MRYIDLDPVRARMVAHPAGNAWSSYRHNAAGKTSPAIISHPLYRQLGHDKTTRCHAYRELFTNHVDPDLLHEIRHTTNQELVLGSGQFKQQIENILGRQTEERPRGRPRKAGSG